MARTKLIRKAAKKYIRKQPRQKFNGYPDSIPPTMSTRFNLAGQSFPNELYVTNHYRQAIRIGSGQPGIYN